MPDCVVRSTVQAPKENNCANYLIGESSLALRVFSVVIKSLYQIGGHGSGDGGNVSLDRDPSYLSVFALL